MSRSVVSRPSYELRRSRTDRKLGGVLGGFAEHFDIDPTVLRVGYVLVSVISAAFPGFLVYLLLWLIIPSAPEGDPGDEAYADDDDYLDTGEY
jgi:phage shock protein C